MRGILLLDLDGTLVDTADDLAAALNLLLAEAGAEALPAGAVRDLVGDGARRLVERGLAARGLDLDVGAATERFLELYSASIAAYSRPYPRVPETLDRLAATGWRLTVCTNKPEAASRALLATVDLDRHFELVIGGDTLPRRKPDPLPLRHIVASCGSTALPAVMVGDGANDLLAAAAAELPVVWARYGYGGTSGEHLPHQAAIDSFAALPRVLEGLPFSVSPCRPGT